MKVLVTHVPAGSGHLKAAEAVAGAVKQLKPNAETILLNGLDEMPRSYQYAFTEGYLGLIHHWPFLWGLLYHALDFPGIAGAATFKIHRLSNSFQGKALEGILLREKPDVFIATHFFPVEVASHLKLKGLLKGRVIAVITDYMPHNVWIAPGIDTYAVGMDLTKEELVRRGIPAGKIQVTGIPIDPKFSRKGDRDELAAKLGIDKEKFTLLIVSGGFGTGPIEELVQELRNIPDRLQALIVTGKNTALYQKLEALRPSFPHDLKVYGFVDNMDELMDVADLMVTKPGGLSCTEALTKGLPMVLVAPIPGQEARNARIIEKFGAAVLAGPVKNAPEIIRRLRKNPAKLAEMGHKAKLAGRPDAAMAVAKLALA